MTVRERLVDTPSQEFLTPAPPLLPITDERITLRPFEVGDERAFTAAWTNEAWTSLLLASPMNASATRTWVAQRVDRDSPSFFGPVVVVGGEVVGDLTLHL